MDSRRLRNFVTVVETGSIARAAQVLHIAQPALSVQMRQMENLAGCQLLSRSSRGVTPTANGIEFCRRAKETLKLLDSLRAIGQEDAASPAGHVVIGTAVSAANMIAVPLVQAVRARYPAITLGLTESPSVLLGELLQRGRLDIAVLFDENISPGMHALPVLEEDLFVIGLPGETDGGDVDLERLHGVPLVMPARPNTLRTLLDRACAERGIVPELVTEVSSPYTMVQLVRAGIGATVLPCSMLGGMRPADLPLARIVHPVLSRSLSVVTASDAPQSPQLLAVKGLLVDLFTQQVSSGQWQGARLKLGPQARLTTAAGTS